VEPRDQQVRAFFESPDQYLSRRFGIRIRAELVRELLGEERGERILDVGCGDGSLSLQLLAQDTTLTLLDISENMLEIAKSRVAPDLADNLSCHNMDFMSFDPGRTFDIILCIGVLAHVSSVDRTIRKISDLLEPGGRCILQFSDQDRALARLEVHYARLRQRLHDHYGYSLNLMTADEVLALASGAGLRYRDSRRYSLLLPGMGKLPAAFLYRYQRMTLKLPLLSRFGTEVVALFDKAE
jgi:2-polyprenyl-3-methyl-5-hydroxy-6-metoxy-1,4-benzoquinol methylase